MDEKDTIGVERFVTNAEHAKNAATDAGSPYARKELCDIGWAVAHLRNGHAVARHGWNGKNTWLKMQFVYEASPMTHSYIYIEYPPGGDAYPQGSRVPWAASQTDLLASDWYRVG